MINFIKSCFYVISVKAETFFTGLSRNKNNTQESLVDANKFLSLSNSKKKTMIRTSLTVIYNLEGNFIWDSHPINVKTHRKLDTAKLILRRIF